MPGQAAAPGPAQAMQGRCGVQAGRAGLRRLQPLTVSRQASAATSHSLSVPSAERDSSRPGRLAALPSSRMSLAWPGVMEQGRAGQHELVGEGVVQAAWSAKAAVLPKGAGMPACWREGRRGGRGASGAVPGAARRCSQSEAPTWQQRDHLCSGDADDGDLPVASCDSLASGQGRGVRGLLSLATPPAWQAHRDCPAAAAAGAQPRRRPPGRHRPGGAPPAGRAASSRRSAPAAGGAVQAGGSGWQRGLLKGAAGC
jgi:hypothetical protein